MNFQIIFLLSIPCFACGVKTHRQKRNLLFTPRNNIVQLILGTGVPVPLEGNQALTIGYVLKAAYLTPNNASVFTNPYVTVQKRSTEDHKASRYDIYRSLEDNLVMPSSTDEPVEKPTDHIYEAAYRLSKSEDVSCKGLFPECQRSLLDIVSVQV